MSARLFAAVLPPDTLVEELDALLEPRRDPGGRPWRWTDPRTWHLTTTFMASVPAVAQPSLEEALLAVTADTQPFDLRVAGGLCLPDVIGAKVLTLGVSQGQELLGHLALRCRQAAARAGANPDGARFIAHLTLARANRPLDATRWVQLLDSFPGWGWTVEEIVVVESHLAQRRHEVVGRFSLGAASSPCAQGRAVEPPRG